jgi:chromosome segregation ATPase
MKDAAIIIEKRESEIVDLKYNLAITEEKLDSARRDAEQHEKKAFQLQTKLDEMKGMESLIARLEALEARVQDKKPGT